ncbi:MAG: DUF192 domain-containing protein [Candidatus Omnitrophica bacterium]|nr:DUF192 domain-containing protein [Candidatus Omnitrophota bacterium]MDD5351559.1 DUF192 domain-containing protein [Candidatus Omnitrophota bacterium]MDD5550994.1 DUF192 domain-containing protein [Candidatus Omnitrophota bacterium]
MGNVRIINRTKNTILADKAEMAETFLKRLRGLLGRDNLAAGEGLVIKPCNSIHTFFMRFSIDVAFLDKSGKVVAMAVFLPPLRLQGSWFRGHLVIELPAGTLARTNTALKDTIEIAET